MRPNWFIGIPVPAGEWLDAICKQLPDGLRCFHPDDLHLTVAFLGQVSKKNALEAWVSAREHPPPQTPITFAGLKPFGPVRRRSVLSLVLDEGRESLTQYIGRHRDCWVTSAGGRLDKRAPLPHITVARIPRRADDDYRKACISAAASIDLPDVSIYVEDLVLYTWAKDRTKKLFRKVEGV